MVRTHAVDPAAIAFAAFLAWRVTRRGAFAGGLVIFYTAAGIEGLLKSPGMRSGVPGQVDAQHREQPGSRAAAAAPPVSSLTPCQEETSTNPPVPATERQQPQPAAHPQPT